MGKNLVIVESPTKSKTLSRFLGNDYDIVSTVGHIIDLPKSKLGVDIENDFEPQYVVIKGKEKILNELRKAAKKADTIFLAPDPDREGEAIAWHVANSLREKGIKSPVHRVTFNEITKSAVTAAIASPREINENLVNAQQARRVLDRLVGYSVSPFLWKTVARNLSAGRVQSVALRLVCEREAEIRAFTPEEYWKIIADLGPKKTGPKFSANLHKIDGVTVGTPTDNLKKKVIIDSEKQAKKIRADLEKADYTVADIKGSSRTRKPLPPFITSTLQQDAARAFGFSPKLTMSLAQKLYEGIELGKEGQTGLITYMRTDSTRVSGEALTAVRKHIGNEYGPEYLPKSPIQYGKAKKSQDAHEAIRPTYLDHPPEKVKRFLAPREFKLYTLIWNRFVASQMNPAKYAVTTVTITAGQYELRATAEAVTFDGWLRVYADIKDDDENGDTPLAKALPKMSAGDSLVLRKLDSNQSFTKPPPRYSEASLVKRLEQDGIGRPSTYASIISVIKDRKYVDSEQRRLKPTDLGEAVNKVLTEHFPELFDVAFTANMEQELDGVEMGSEDWVDVINDMYAPLNSTLTSLQGKEAEIKAAMTETTDIPCEKCGQPMVVKMGRNGRFLACSGYPDCKSTKPLPEDEAKTKTDFSCEKCGSPMVIKTGRFGRFLACSGYPDCKNAKPLLIGVKCPKPDCGGDLVEKQTRSRRLFFGCSNYPDCDFASWDRPIPIPCPVCEHAYVVLKTSKAKGEFLRCPECKHETSEEGLLQQALEKV